MTTIQYRSNGKLFTFHFDATEDVVKARTQIATKIIDGTVTDYRTWEKKEKE